MAISELAISPGDHAGSQGEARHSGSAASPAFSLVIPALNEVNRLPKFLESAGAYLCETMESRFEIIVVDDGSSDGTDSMLKEWSADSPQYRFVQHPLNRGKGAALRSGLAAAKGNG